MKGNLIDKFYIKLWDPQVPSTKYDAEVELYYNDRPKIKIFTEDYTHLSVGINKEYFDERNLSFRSDYLVGVRLSTPFTFVNCDVISWSSDHTLLRAEYCLESKLIENDTFGESEEILFQRVEFGFNMIENWMNFSSFSNTFSNEPTIKYTKIPVKNITLDEFSLEISSEGKTDLDFNSNKASISHRVKFEANYNEEQSVEKILDMIRHVQYFLCFALQRKVSIRYISFIEEKTHLLPEKVEEIDDDTYGFILKFAGNKEQIAELHKMENQIPTYVSFYSRIISGEESGFIHPYDVLLHFNFINERLELLLSKWFEIKIEYDMAIELYFLKFFIGTHFPNNEFLNLTQAVEMMHRMLDSFDDIYLTKDQNKIIKTRLVSIFDKILDSALLSFEPKIGYRERMISQISYAYEFSQRKRFQQLLTEFNYCFDIDEKDLIKFKQKVVNGRNYLTHLSPESKKVKLSEKNMVIASKVLRYYFTVTLMSLLNIPKEDIESTIKSYIEKTSNFTLQALIEVFLSK